MLAAATCLTAVLGGFPITSLNVTQAQIDQIQGLTLMSVAERVRHRTLTNNARHSSHLQQMFFLVHKLQHRRDKSLNSTTIMPALNASGIYWSNECRHLPRLVLLFLARHPWYLSSIIRMGNTSR